MIKENTVDENEFEETENLCTPHTEIAIIKIPSLAENIKNQELTNEKIFQTVNKTEKNCV